MLDALDAYNKRLVKRIEVKGFEVKNFRGTDRYLYHGELSFFLQKAAEGASWSWRSPTRSPSTAKFRVLGVGDNLYYHLR